MCRVFNGYAETREGDADERRDYFLSAVLCVFSALLSVTYYVKIIGKMDLLTDGNNKIPFFTYNFPFFYRFIKNFLIVYYNFYYFCP